ncbi:glutamine synthetase/guanido kinase [Gonapodya prolifera JEL478]|uniref:Glutamine synthetase/guanido kinase n=1 Tax=Gonapodya prolifera (strain JEL478) TaxID=1344416 RepID=A0A139ALZ8_GONPJ|nr:glutamine synthetase/guanido kinase [Gonapodya prolifera JEL478]|eukprot:KXS17806.1 glutamine synthetase/guanido kinase [Gonapodya prolifera JEL478]
MTVDLIESDAGFGPSPSAQKTATATANGDSTKTYPRLCDKDQIASAKEWCKQHSIHGVHVLLVDYGNVARTIAYTVPRFLSILKSGTQTNFTVPAMLLYKDTVAQGSVFSVFTGPDFRFDLASLKLVPWLPGHALCMAYQYSSDGITPWAYDARSFLKKQLDEFRELTGCEVVVGPEFEFFLWREDDKGVPTKYHTSSAQEFAAFRSHGGKVSQILDAINASLETAGLNPQHFQSEGAPSQFELSILHKDAMTTADNMVYTRECIRAVPEVQFGTKATLSPKPFLDTFGNGSHIHISFLDPTSNTNVFPSPSGKFGISELGQHFMAGILDHLTGLCAVVMPTEMSYDRAVPGNWSGCFKGWGVENRMCALRLQLQVPHGTARDVEFKVQDHTSNPYLSIGCIIAAGMDGIRRKLPLPDPVEKEPEKLSPEEVKATGAARLPTSLKEALKCLEGDEYLKEVLGPIYKEYYLMKMDESTHCETLDALDKLKLFLRKY